MTMTDIETWELTIPDEVAPCYVVVSGFPDICVDYFAMWIVTANRGPGEYELCDGCKDRWASFGNIKSARLIKD